MVKNVEVEVRFHEETRTDYSGSGLLFRKCFPGDLAGRDTDLERLGPRGGAHTAACVRRRGFNCSLQVPKDRHSRATFTPQFKWCDFYIIF